jgi:NADP-dependent 3-hydroxy acid dehydrogenase YdfG
LLQRKIGIGRCIAHELAALGATIIIAARKIEPLNIVQDEIQKLGGICDTMLLNIRDAAMATQVIEDIVAKHGKLNGLVVSGEPVLSFLSCRYLERNVYGIFYLPY